MSGNIKIIAAELLALTPVYSAADTNAFHDWHRIDESSLVSLGLVNAPADGVVEVYEIHKGQVGELVGASKVHGGVNPDVRVNTGDTRRYDVIAVLRIDGDIVAEREFEINRR